MPSERAPPMPSSSPKPKVPHVTVCYLLPNLEVGGLQRALVTIAAQAFAHRGEVVVCSLHRSPSDHETMEPALTRAGARIVHLEVSERADRKLRSLGSATHRFRTWLNHSQIDIVDSAIFEADLVARVAMIGTRQPLVTHLVNTTHDVDEVLPQIGRSPRRRRLVRSIDRITGRATDHFVALTSAVAESARRNLDIEPEKLSIIPRAVDLDHFQFVGPKDRDNSAVFRFICVGRLAPQKSISTVIDALAEIDHVHERVHVTVYGDGPLAGELTKKVDDLGLSGVVEFAGVTTEVSSIHHRSDALLFPSAHEGLGNTLIEAMACGTPTIASDIPVLREVGGSSIAYASPGDATMWARAMEAMMEQPAEARDRTAREARSRVVDRYSPEANIGALFDLYRELLAKRS